LILQGLTRIELVSTIQLKPYRIAAIRPLVAEQDNRVLIDALVAKVHELVEERVQMAPPPFPFAGLKNAPGKKAGGQENFAPGEVLQYLESIQDPEQLSDLVSCALLSGAIERQTILETVPVEERLKHLIHFLMEEIRRLRKEKGCASARPRLTHADQSMVSFDRLANRPWSAHRDHASLR
jgi:ATP-dependent Lon protease